MPFTDESPAPGGISAGRVPGGTSGETASSGAAGSLAAGVDLGIPTGSDSAQSGFRHRLKHGLTRGLYWLPVFAPMVVFGEIALCGLRPALCERARLKEAEAVLEERYATDAAQHEIISANLRARQDPIFLERQRRWLRVAAPAR